MESDQSSSLPYSRGRELYPLSVDKLRYILPSVGESTTGKTLMEDVMQELYMDSAKVFIVTSDTQEGFGPDGMQDAERIVLADAEKTAKRVFPLSATSLEVVIEGGKIHLAHKQEESAWRQDRW